MCTPDSPVVKLTEYFAADVETIAHVLQGERFITKEIVAKAKRTGKKEGGACYGCGAPAMGCACHSPTCVKCSYPATTCACPPIAGHLPPIRMAVTTAGHKMRWVSVREVQDGYACEVYRASVNGQQRRICRRPATMVVSATTGEARGYRCQEHYPPGALEAFEALRLARLSGGPIPDLTRIEAKLVALPRRRYHGYFCEEGQAFPGDYGACRARAAWRYEGGRAVLGHDDTDIRPVAFCDDHKPIPELTRHNHKHIHADEAGVEYTHQHKHDHKTIELAAGREDHPNDHAAYRYDKADNRREHTRRMR
jgi:hypothetical protein